MGSLGVGPNHGTSLDTAFASTTLGINKANNAFIGYLQIEEWEDDEGNVIEVCQPCRNLCSSSSKTNFTSQVWEPFRMFSMASMVL